VSWSLFEVSSSPALKAGLQANDLLTSFNGRSLENISLPDFVNLIRAQAVGTVVTIEFVRQGVKKTVPLTVEVMP
jgi:S1-C subfamily serine protease